MATFSVTFLLALNCVWLFIALYQHERRREAEDNLAALMWRQSINDHPAGRRVQWWQKQEKPE